MEINKINDFLNFTDYDQKKVIPNKTKVDFGDLLNSAMQEVNQSQIESDEYKELLAIGELDNLHDLTIAAEKANISLQVAMSIRTKITEAYKELMRIQI